MTPDPIALARRAVACPGWRWRSGMLVIPESHPDERWRLVWTEDQYAGAAQAHRPYKVWAIGFDEHDSIDLSDGWLPDLSDDATCGCLLALAREAWGENRLVWVAPNRHPSDPDMVLGVVIYEDTNGARWTFDEETEAESLIAALEAAPRRT
jgi:hypothetical protein